MDIDNIKELIKGGESKELEFKKSTAQLKGASETLCAFINTNGGIVLVGVKNDGKIVGQHITDETKLEISNLVGKFEPPAHITIKYILVKEDKYIIVMSVNPNHSTIPCTFDGRAFWRVESSTKRMPQQRYNEMLLMHANKSSPWDVEVASHVGVEDLDGEEVIKMLNDSFSRGRTEQKLGTKNVDEALLRLKLTKNGDLINAAGILFCKDAESHFPQSLIRLARFKGVTKGNIIDSKRVYGNAFKLIEEAELFVMRHMSISSDFVAGKMARNDYPEYSTRAVREAIVNAISHRDYTLSGGSISLMMYDDRLEIISHGNLPNGIRIQDLMTAHESFPRNGRITHILYKRGIIESVGMGTQEMIQECQKIHAPDPEYFEKGNTFVVLFHSNPMIKKEIEQSQFVKPRQAEILSIMSSFNKGCTTTKIMEQMSNPPSARTLRNDLRQLEKDKFVTRHGEGSATIWFLTKKV